MSNPKQKEILILFLCLLIGFALRFYTYDRKSLWMDEVYTFNDSRYGFKEQLAFYKENPTFLHPPSMTYHISLSQDGRSYSLLMFLGIAGLYFFMKHLKSSKKRYLILVALFFAILFHTSYSSIPFITLSQILWFYRPNQESKKPTLSSFFILNVLILLFCLPWIIFVAANYLGQTLMDSRHTEGTGSLFHILYGIINDWATNY